MRGSIVYPERRGRRVACVLRESCRAAIEWLPPYLHTMCTMHQCGRGNCNAINEKEYTEATEECHVFRFLPAPIRSASEDEDGRAGFETER